MLKTKFVRFATSTPKLETERLILRKLLKTDAGDMFEYSSNPRVSKFLTWSAHPDPSYTRDYLKFLISKYKTGEYLDWAIIKKDDGKMIGTVGYTVLDLDNKRAEIGYVLNEKFWHMGYAREAVEKVIDFSFSEIYLHRIEARVIEGNEPSVNLLEKMGFEFEGKGIDELIVKNEYKNVLHFSKISKD